MSHNEERTTENATTDTAAQLASLAELQRAIPPCPHFGACGGCQLQHLTYSAQLESKAAKLRELLASFTLPELQLHGSPPLAYRNRIRLTLARVDGQLRAGYLGAAKSADPDAETENNALIPTDAALAESGEVEGSPHFDRHEFVPITQCPIAAPLLWRAAEAFLALAYDAPWLTKLQLIPDQLELFTTADESKLQLTLFLRTAQKSPPAKLAADFTTLCQSLHVQLPQLAGAGIALLPLAARSRRTEQPRPGPAWGAPGLNYTVAVEDTQPTLPNAPRTTDNEQPLTYWIPRGAFFQVNRFLLPELVSLVVNTATAAQDHALAWDLYAGVGLFAKALFAKRLSARARPSPALAPAFASVTAVEIAEPAATVLVQTKLPNLCAVKATTVDFLRSAVLQRERPSFIILDPPRTGLGAEVCALLARIAAPTLVYVSCSPQALARDLALLTANGYSIAGLHLFDLFPQTAHIETVAILSRT